MNYNEIAVFVNEAFDKNYITVQISHSLFWQINHSDLSRK
jgi:hypothetical protein